MTDEYPYVIKDPLQTSLVRITEDLSLINTYVIIKNVCQRSLVNSVRQSIS